MRPGWRARPEHPRQNVTDGSGPWIRSRRSSLAVSGPERRSSSPGTTGAAGSTTPVKEPWDSAQAQRPEDANAQFDGDPFRFGSRVPCLVLGPYAKAGHVSSQENSHVSLLRFCEATIGLAALTDGDAQSIGMSDCFDLTQSPVPLP
jgi:phospholipase C